MERVYSYNPGARTGQANTVQFSSHSEADIITYIKDRFTQWLSVYLSVCLSVCRIILKLVDKFQWNYSEGCSVWPAKLTRFWCWSGSRDIRVRIRVTAALTEVCILWVLQCQWTLRSAATNRMMTPSVKFHTVCSRAFPAAAFFIWKTLPENVISVQL